MAPVYLGWVLTLFVMCIIAVLLGVKSAKRGPLGIFIDERGRYSLTRFQMTLWTLLILSLIVGVFCGRLASDPSRALGFTIPPELLAVLGISVGSAVIGTTIKTTKDSSAQASNVAASDASDKPFFAQMFMVEEGTEADKVIDITKFQNFWITVLLIVAYAILVVADFLALDSPSMITALPGFGSEFIVLLGISHAGYLAAKIPDKPGTPPGLTVAGLRDGAVAVTQAPVSATVINYQARRP